MSAKINFACQRCLTPIKIDNSFASIDEHTLAELHLPLYAPPTLDLNEAGAGASALLDKIVGPIGVSDHTTSDFTIVGHSLDTASEGNKLRVQAELFDVLSHNTEVDHPLCEECCDTLTSLLQSELQEVESECTQYQEFLTKLQTEPDSDDIESLEAQLKDLKTEENTLKSELTELKEKEGTALENLERYKVEHARLKEQEEQFLKEYCRHKRQLYETYDQYQSLDNELRYVESQLDRLERTNALNATFHIWHSGHFGTINTFRLGRLPSEPVSWDEINAAWGQTALLLNSLARKINFKFSTYQIVPFGNNSYIKVLADNQELPLHGSGGFRFSWDNKFDQGMVAFLDCLNQLQAAMLQRQGQEGFSLPYKMEDKGKIVDKHTQKSYSIKIQLNSEEQWTKALKYMLTNLKWALAWVSSQTVNDENT